MPAPRPRIPPYDTPFRRRHRPGPVKGSDGYQDFTPCLRWEFGFTCPFCLLHQAELTGSSEVPLQGSALSWVEHLRLKSRYPELANDYDNCYLSCRFCNNGRGDRYPHVRQDGLRLLDPCRDAWALHFERRDDELVPLTERGRYTLEVYRLNDVHRQRRRQTRVRAIRDTPRKIREALHLLREIESGPDRRSEGAQKTSVFLRRLIPELQQQWTVTLERFEAVPADAPEVCHCGTRDHHSLPDNLRLEQSEV